MPVRSPSPKHFKWRSRTSFVEVIPPSSFIGWDEQSRRTLYSATSLRRTCLDIDRTPTHSRKRVADSIDLNQGWSASGHSRLTACTSLPVLSPKADMIANCRHVAKGPKHHTPIAEA